MSTIQAKDFTSLVQNMVATIQGTATQLLDLSVGSVLRAIFEAVAGVVLWLQALILQVQTMTRAATSVGADLDSFYADFGFYRLAAAFSTGQVTFSRFTATAAATIPVGTTIETADGSQAYAVAVDITNSSYNATLNAYVLPINASSITLPVKATTPGAGGNVLAGTVTAITQALPGIDAVTNANPFTNGLDAENDPAFRARFQLYIASLSKGTKDAIRSAIANIQQGMQVIITEDFQYNGTYDPGFFYVVVDDGSGAPSSNLLATVYNAIDAVRALAVRFGVFAPVIVTANVSLIVTSATGYDHPTVVGSVGTALRAFLNTLPLGADLSYTQIASIAYSIPGVTNVTAVLVNSATADLVATDQQVIKAGTVSVA